MNPYKIKLVCKECNKVFDRYDCERREGQLYFCSRPCQHKYYQATFTENQKIIWQDLVDFGGPASASDLADISGFSHNAIMKFFRKATRQGLIKIDKTLSDKRTKKYKRIKDFKIDL